MFHKATKKQVVVARSSTKVEYRSTALRGTILTQAHFHALFEAQRMAHILKKPEEREK